MMSRTGVTEFDTAFLRAIQMPSGMPTTMQITTASSVMMSVSMLSDHRSTTPKNRKVAVTRMVERRPAKA